MKNTGQPADASLKSNPCHFVQVAALARRGRGQLEKGKPRPATWLQRAGGAMNFGTELVIARHCARHQGEYHKAIRARRV